MADNRSGDPDKISRDVAVRARIAQAQARIAEQQLREFARLQPRPRNQDPELDDFIAGLQYSLDCARSKIAERRLGQLEQVLQLDQEGRTELMEWSVVLDSGGANPGETRTVRLPLGSMRTLLLPPQIAEFSIELPVTVEEQEPQPPETEGRMTLVVHRRKGFLRRRLHSLKVRLFGPGPNTVEIEFDGQRLKTMEPNVRPKDDGGDVSPGRH